MNVKHLSGQVSPAWGHLVCLRSLNVRFQGYTVCTPIILMWCKDALPSAVSCYILGENSWRAQTSFCCHTWTRLDLHLCCFDVFYFSPQCQSPNDHCSSLHSSLGRCRTDILSHPELHTVSNLCLRLSLVRRPSQRPTLNLCQWEVKDPRLEPRSEISHHVPAGEAQKCAAPGFRAASDIFD